MTQAELDKLMSAIDATDTPTDKEIAEETHRYKIGEAGKGRIQSLETVARRKQTMAERTPEEIAEHHQKISESTLGRKASDETKAKQSKYGKHRSPEHLANLSKALKGNTNSKGHVPSAETRAKISAGNKGKISKSIKIQRRFFKKTVTKEMTRREMIALFDSEYNFKAPQEAVRTVAKHFNHVWPEEETAIEKYKAFFKRHASSTTTRNEMIALFTEEFNLANVCGPVDICKRELNYTWANTVRKPRPLSADRQKWITFFEQNITSEMTIKEMKELFKNKFNHKSYGAQVRDTAKHLNHTWPPK